MTHGADMTHTPKQREQNPKFLILLRWVGFNQNQTKLFLRDKNMSEADLKDWVFGTCPTGWYVEHESWSLTRVEYIAEAV